MIVKDEKDNIIVDTESNKTPEIKMVKSPYHLAEIQKGVLGEISKIEEEFAELKDAEAQGIKLMVYIELSDMYGAMESYAVNRGITMEDVKNFSDLNKRVRSGKVS